ncbi:MAG: hypothetical protein ABMB14_40040, partial [Myxococcota bacterium]
MDWSRTLLSSGGTLLDLLEHDTVDPETATATLDALSTEAAGWPPTDDLERLGAAFDALNRRGIHAVGPAGFTTQEACAIAIDRIVTLEDGGAEPLLGYAVFHRQDVWHAVEGHGLRIGYASVIDDARAVEVGAAVADACRRAGFEVRWSGHANERIHLPTLTWRVPPRRLTDADLRAFPARPLGAGFLDAWTTELRICVPDDPEALAADRAVHALDGIADLCPALLARIVGETRAIVAAEREAERGWTGATDSDRLSSA